MLGRLVILAALLFATPALAQEESPRPIEVMVLGAYHFANPGRDMVNMEVDDVLAPRRQREIAILTGALARWRPDKVAVEWEAPAPGFELEAYGDVKEMLATRRNESVQIGFRLAHLLNHETVYGFDEQPGEGEPDYFPMGKVQEFADANGQSATLQRLFGIVQEKVGAEQAKLKEQSIAESLIFHNDAAAVDAAHDELYYSLLGIGDGDSQPGAELNAYWYMRNAKMFAKLAMIAEPGDRIFVLVGSGHSTWLRDFIRRAPGFELADATPYLIDAAAASEAITP